MEGHAEDKPADMELNRFSHMPESMAIDIKTLSDGNQHNESLDKDGIHQGYHESNCADSSIYQYPQRSIQTLENEVDNTFPGSNAGSFSFSSCNSSHGKTSSSSSTLNEEEARSQNTSRNNYQDHLQNVAYPQGHVTGDVPSSKADSPALDLTFVGGGNFSKSDSVSHCFTNNYFQVQDSTSSFSHKEVDNTGIPSSIQVEGATESELDRQDFVKRTFPEDNNSVPSSYKRDDLHKKHLEKDEMAEADSSLKSRHGKTSCSSNSTLYEEEAGSVKAKLESQIMSKNIYRDHLENVAYPIAKEGHVTKDVPSSQADKTDSPALDSTFVGGGHYSKSDSGSHCFTNNYFQDQDSTSSFSHKEVDNNVSLPGSTQMEEVTESELTRQDFAKKAFPEDSSSVPFYQTDDQLNEELEQDKTAEADSNIVSSSVQSSSSNDKKRDMSMITSANPNHDAITIDFPKQDGSICAKENPAAETENNKIYSSLSEEEIGQEETATRDNVCFFCMQSFDSLGDLECHEVTHADENPYRCSFCPRIFGSYEKRGEHEQSCRQSRGKVFQNKAVSGEEGTTQRAGRGRKHKIKIDYSEIHEFEFEESEEAVEDKHADNYKDIPKIKIKVEGSSSPTFKIEVEGSSSPLVKKKRRKKSLKDIAGRAHKCPLCPVSFTRNSHLTKHLQNVHSITGFTCSICKKLCQTKTELEEHEPSHTCDVCGKLIKYLGSMEQHKQLHTKGHKQKKAPTTETDSEKLLCKVCGMKFKYFRSARDHEKRHIEPPIYKCMKCPRKFPTDEKRLNHQQICEPNIYPCKQCKETFKYSYQLNMHIIEVHTGNYYTCELCGQKFSNKGTWKTHTKLHTKEKQFKCTECSKEFHFKASLKDHMAQVHSDEKPFQCMYCGIGLKSKGALKKHEGLHTGAFVFKCEYCTMEFNSRMKLSTHVQEKHTGRKYICVKCGKAFTNMRFLKNHELIHTGEKPYKCPHCDARFRRQHHVTQHIPRHFKLTKQLSNYVDIALR